MTENATQKKLSPFAKLLIISGIIFAVALYVIIQLAFRPDPFSNDLEGSESMQLEGVPEKLPNQPPIQLPNSEL